MSKNIVRIIHYTNTSYSFLVFHLAEAHYRTHKVPCRTSSRVFGNYRSTWFNGFAELRPVMISKRMQYGFVEGHFKILDENSWLSLSIGHFRGDSLSWKTNIARNTGELVAADTVLKPCFKGVANTPTKLVGRKCYFFTNRGRYEL